MLIAISLCAALGQPQFEALLPRGGVVIETADVSAVAGKPRVMVLWMLNPAREMSDKFNRNREGGFCSDVLHGDFGKFWKGPTRLSLVDASRSKIVNTIEIGDSSFVVPVCVFNPHALGPSPEWLGRPNLSLRDYTGRGRSTEFALYAFEAFGIADTAVFGYESSLDQVMQYPIEWSPCGEKPLVKMWTEEVFAWDPVRPGYWKFDWEPGHSPGPVVMHEEVHFDLARLRFVQKECESPR